MNLIYSFSGNRRQPHTEKKNGLGRFFRIMDPQGPSRFSSLKVLISFNFNFSTSNAIGKARKLAFWILCMSAPATPLGKIPHFRRDPCSDQVKVRKKVARITIIIIIINKKIKNKKVKMMRLGDFAGGVMLRRHRWVWSRRRAINLFLRWQATRRQRNLGAEDLLTGTE